MTSTQTRTTKQATISRTITVSREVEPWGTTTYATVFEQHQGKRSVKNISDVYVLTRIAGVQFGLGVHVEKVAGQSEGQVYDVLLNGPGGGHSCDCPHGSYKGHVKPCRHIEAALQAVKEQKL
jgi:hypothetical protein